MNSETYLFITPMRGTHTVSFAIVVPSKTKTSPCSHRFVTAVQVRAGVVHSVSEGKGHIRPHSMCDGQGISQAVAEEEKIKCNHEWRGAHGGGITGGAPRFAVS